MADYKTPVITGTSLTAGDLLRWDGSDWVNYPDSNYGVGGLNTVKSNVALNAFRIAINGGLVVYNIVDGIVDEFEDESGVDTATSANEDYDSTDDFYEPYVDEATLLVHFDGIDEATSHTAETGQVLTFIGDAQLDTAIKKFGTASLLLDGDDRVTIPDSNDWFFGTGDFTIEAQIYMTSYPDAYATILNHGDTEGYTWNVRVLKHDGVDEWKINCYYSKSDGSGSVILTDVLTENELFGGAALNNWHHIVLVRTSGVMKIFMNGVEKYSAAEPAGAYNYNYTGVLTIGREDIDGGRSYFIGQIDEIRISKGIAKWTSGFTPPTSAHSTAVQNMTLVSETFIAEAEADLASIFIFEQDVDAVTINTDLKAYISRDGGTTWTEVTLADEGDYESERRILVAHDINISGQPNGTDMQWKIVSANNKNCKLHGVSLQWR